jgi:hypothetical protein
MVRVHQGPPDNTSLIFCSLTVSNQIAVDLDKKHHPKAGKRLWEERPEKKVKASESSVKKAQGLYGKLLRAASGCLGDNRR